MLYTDNHKPFILTFGRKVKRFLKDNKELLAEIINSSDNNGKAIGKTERAVRDSDAVIRKNLQPKKRSRGFGMGM